MNNFSIISKSLKNKAMLGLVRHNFYTKIEKHLKHKTSFCSFDTIFLKLRFEPTHKLKIQTVDFYLFAVNKTAKKTLSG